jgi:hypothetical protein
MSKEKTKTIIDDQLKDIEESIGKIDSLTDINKIIQKYKLVKDKLSTYKEKIKKYEEQINMSDKSSEDSLDNITSAKFKKNMKELENIKNEMINNNVSNIDDLIDVYTKTQQLIKESQSYLETKKTEILNIEEIA